MSAVSTPTGVGQQGFQLRQRVYALQDGTPRRATIIDVSGDSADGTAKFYVRFLDQDSRMDAWFAASDLRPCEAKIVRQGSSAMTPTITTRSMASRAQPVSEEPPKRQPVQADGVTVSRQRKDSSFFSRPKNIASIMIGEYDVDAWYFSPYHAARPQVRANLETCAPCFLTDLNNQSLDVRQESAQLQRRSTPVAFVLHVCPFCLEPFACHSSVVRHLHSVCMRHPPGFEVYRDPQHNIVVFELDGKAEPVFANHLALLSKLFLEHKALDCDMTPFLFYVLCQVTTYGCQVLGYFSKEKVSPDGFNLSCILTLPQFQGRGIGRFLVEASYELTRREGKVGSPEKPLSDLGEVTYMSYWKDTVMDVLAAVSDKGSGVSIEAIAAATCMTQQDVIATLQKLNILSGGGGKQNRKFSLCVTSEHIRQHEERKARRLADSATVYAFDPALLCWSPSWYEQVVELPQRILVPGYADSRPRKQPRLA